jgi:hypothetical protein
MKFLNKWFVVLAVLSFAACEELTELDLLDNPNQISPEQAEPRFLYNSIQLRFSTVLEQTFDFGADLSRQTAMTSGFVYQNAYQPTAFDALWRNVYAGIFPDIVTLKDLAADRGLVIHAATADIMKAYLMMTLVDLFGDVPYSEIGQGIDLQNPKADPGADVYADALALLEDAMRALENTTSSTPALPSEIDNFYGGSVSGWLRAANTLKLRAGVMTRLAGGGATQLVTDALNDEAGIIAQPSQDFQWTYGTNRNNPNNRHFLYNDFYETTDGRYLSNWYMWLLAESKTFVDDAGNEQTLEDPRTPFYFYRQALGLADEIVDNPNAFDCQYGLSPDDIPDHYLAVSEDMPYCLGSYRKSFFGRDHGNGSGIPPDGELRTNWGLYPMGGSFDPGTGNSDRLNAGTDGALGGGIFPVLLSSWTHMYLAEAALTMDVTTPLTAEEHLMTAIEQSIDKAFSFADKIDLTRVVATVPEVVTVGDVVEGVRARKQGYLDYVAQEYANATTDDDRLGLVIREFFIAAWGNGMETYNAYRRTCKPADIQPTLERSPGEFIRSALYPAVFVNLNTSVSQKSILDPVFWDTNDDSCTY